MLSVGEHLKLLDVIKISMNLPDGSIPYASGTAIQTQLIIKAHRDDVVYSVLTSCLDSELCEVTIKNLTTYIYSFGFANEQRYRPIYIGARISQTLKTRVTRVHDTNRAATTSVLKYLYTVPSSTYIRLRLLNPMIDPGRGTRLAGVAFVLQCTVIAMHLVKVMTSYSNL